MIYTKDEKMVNRALGSAYFSDLEELTLVYELENRKPRIKSKRPFQIGIADQLANQRMLGLYNYIAISTDRREDIVHPELYTELEAAKKEWHGTSGAGVRRGCSKSNVKAAG